MSEALRAPDGGGMPARSARSRAIDAHAVRMLALAGGCLVLAAIVYALALGVDDLLRADRDLRFPQIVGDWRFRDDASWAFSRASEAGFAAAAAALLIGSLLAAGFRRAVIVAGVVGAGPLAGWALGALLASTDPVGGEVLRASQGAFPSGHAAIALSLGLGLVVALPARHRVVGGIVAVVVATAVAVSVVALGWHYPSDVAGAFLISLAGAAAVAAAAPAERGRSRTLPRGSSAGPLAALIAGALVATGIAGAVALWALPDERARAFVDAHPGFVAYCAAAALLALVCVALFARLLGISRLQIS